MQHQLIALVRVNGVDKGPFFLSQDGRGRFLLPAGEFGRLGLGAAPPAALGGDRQVVLDALPGVQLEFDPTAVVLELRFAAAALPGSVIDLSPRRRAGVEYPADPSVYLNYGLNVDGDRDFGQRRYQLATELAARYGRWLLYNTTDTVREGGSGVQTTRLLTNAQFDDRAGLQRLTLGDFFTAADVAPAAIPMGGINLAKAYSMDPYFIRFPTGTFRAEALFPSTVQVKIGGNVVAQRNVPPGPVDITNITGVTGGAELSVVLRDPFGREQVLQQPFFFATRAGLAPGLHDYNYSVGALRENYGTASADYGPLAAAAAHRYGVDERLTIGAIGQAAPGLIAAGPLATYQWPRFGIIGGSIIGSRFEGRQGWAGEIAYSYTGSGFALNLGTRELSRDYAQLANLLDGPRLRNSRYASASVYSSRAGTLTATYAAQNGYDTAPATSWSVNFTRSLLQNRGLFALGYTEILQPTPVRIWGVSLRYFFDAATSAVAGVGHDPRGSFQTVALQQTTPQGQGLGYEVSATRTGADATYALGRAFVQVNAAHAEFGAEYQRATLDDAAGQRSRAFVAGSVGVVDGVAFAGRPVADSLALIRVATLPQVPVYVNGWRAGDTNARGEVVATNLASYYDNIISFGDRDVPLDYVYSAAERVISPPLRSGTLVEFEVKRINAVFGRLVDVAARGGAPLEFRELRLTRGADNLSGFTGRRGEFYVEGVQPGIYRLLVEGDPACAVSLEMPQPTGLIDIGTVRCEGEPPAR
ncbi:MAG: fimbria/pilus outer membrane usher protein [Betaproteobacteria bacterium]